jgi:hypothetical protein
VPRLPENHGEGLDSKGSIAFEEGGQTSRTAWLRIRRWHAATSVVWLISWLVGFVSMLLGGGLVPALDDRLEDSMEGPRPRRADAYPALLVLRRTTGWPRAWQVDYESTFAAAWRGPGAMAPGVAWFRDGVLTWAPKKTWAQLGARSFGLRVDRIERIEQTHLSPRSVGLVVRQSDGAEVWLWLRGKDSRRLLDLLRTYSSQSNR